MDAEGIFLFEGFRLDRRAGGLFRTNENGVLVPVAIGSRALDLLVLLVRRHGNLVPKDEIMTAVWPGMIVAESNLPTQIWGLRRLLDQLRSRGSCIGYRFVAEVTHPAAAAAVAASRVSLGTSISQAILALRLSIVVVPFTNFSTVPISNVSRNGSPTI